MADRYRAVLLFGAPGVGKGTQGGVLGAVPGFCHVSTGDLFRALDPESELGREFKHYSSQGLLVPDEFTVKLWSGSMASWADAGRFDPARDVLVLDGFPRNVTQAEMIRDRVDVLAVVHLKAKDRDAMIARLKNRAIEQGRHDDAKEDVIVNRWKVYEQETSPVLECYDGSLVHEVDAMGTPAEVLQRVLGVVVPAVG
ncbi:MAG: nucleoside monophosphate kinase [Planctomycetota bacterium]